MATSDVRAQLLTTALNSARGANSLDQNDADDVETLIIDSNQHNQHRLPAGHN